MQPGPHISQACDLVPPSGSCLSLSLLSCKSDETWGHLIRKGSRGGAGDACDKQGLIECFHLSLKICLGMRFTS